MALSTRLLFHLGQGSLDDGFVVDAGTDGRSETDIIIKSHCKLLK